MDKIIGLLSRPTGPQDPNAPDDGQPWYLKYGGRVLGIVGAFFAILFGLWNCVSILLADVSCLVGGILQICAGFLVMAVEAPFCCMFIDHVQVLANKVESRPLWNRAAVYCCIAIPPIVLCPGLGSLFGCGLIFATGVIYGMMGLGKKASLADMRTAATQQEAAANKSSTAPRSNLVNNAQPIGTSSAPGFNIV
ncbi:unnamed protein product [Diamesa hyperborea]